MKLKGLIAAVHTPMDDDYSVDYDVVARVGRLIATG